jgi:hypothetical protein
MRTLPSEQNIDPHDAPTTMSASSFGDLAVFSYDCPVIAGRNGRDAGHFYVCRRPLPSRSSQVAFASQNP